MHPYYHTGGDYRRLKPAKRLGSFDLDTSLPLTLASAFPANIVKKSDEQLARDDEIYDALVRLYPDRYAEFLEEQGEQEQKGRDDPAKWP